MSPTARSMGVPPMSPTGRSMGVPPMSPTGLWPVATAGTAVVLTGKLPVLQDEPVSYTFSDDFLLYARGSAAKPL